MKRKGGVWIKKRYPATKDVRRWGEKFIPTNHVKRRKPKESSWEERGKKNENTDSSTG